MISWKSCNLYLHTLSWKIGFWWVGRSLNGWCYIQVGRGRTSTPFVMYNGWCSCFRQARWIWFTSTFSRWWALFGSLRCHILRPEIEDKENPHNYSYNIHGIIEKDMIIWIMFSIFLSPLQLFLWWSWKCRWL